MAPRSRYLPAELLDVSGRPAIRRFELQVFAPDGTFVAAWGDEGQTDEGLLLGPNSLVLDGTGFVYIADVGNDTVQKFRLLPPLAP